MKLKVIVKPTLTLSKEEKVLNYGEEFEVEKERGIEILKTTFEGKPVVELVEEAMSNEELETVNANLTKEKEALEAKVKELEEVNAKLTEEKEALEEKVKELETPDSKNTSKKGENK